MLHLNRKVLLTSAVVIFAGVTPFVVHKALSRPRPFVFLIVVDTLRSDRLSCYGYSGHKTPNMDALAKRGVQFQNAQSPASWTIPAMGSIMTSLYPSQLGLVERPGKEHQQFEWRERREQKSYEPPQAAEMLAEILQSQDYATAAFVNQPALNFRSGFLQGFDEWFYPLLFERRIERHDTSVPIPDTPRPAISRMAHGTDHSLIERFVMWLPNHSDKYSEPCG